MITALEILADLFPFAFVLDPDLRVVQRAAGWDRIGIGPRPGERVDESLTIVRPVMPLTRDAIAAHASDIVVLSAGGRAGFTLRGQFLVRSTPASGEVIVFVGGPWITRLSQLAELGLGLGDFPPHDARGDLLVLIQTQWTNLEDLRQLTDRLRSTAAALETRNRELTEQMTRSTNLENTNTALEATLEQLRRTQDQLIVQEKMASLGTLAAGIAHEIRNPLNFVNNFAALNVDLVTEARGLLAGRGEVPVAEFTPLLDDLELNSAKITEHGKRADSIVRGVLQHARGGSGTAAPADINRLLDDAVTLSYHGMRAQDASFNVTIERTFDTAVPPVLCVPQDVSRVFLNLVNNAAYAANEKRRSGLAGAGFLPTITVSTTAAEDAVTVHVRDNGGGMSEQARARLFEPFFTTKPAGSGTGLGLSLSYDIIVQQHGGRLEIQSVEGEGTVATVVLPVSRESQP